MISKGTITFTIILTLALVFPTCKGDTPGPEEREEPGKKETVIQKDNGLTVYYFHTTYRCYSCNKIETLTKDTIERNFRSELKEGKITFTTVNLDEDRNKHFIQDYQLFTKTVVLVYNEKGKESRWKRLDETWNNLGNEKAFRLYIRNEVSAFINGA